MKKVDISEKGDYSGSNNLSKLTKYKDKKECSKENTNNKSYNGENGRTVDIFNSVIAGNIRGKRLIRLHT